MGSREEGHILGNSSCFCSQQEYFLHTYFPRGLTGSSPTSLTFRMRVQFGAGQAFTLLPVEINSGLGTHLAPIQDNEIKPES